MIAFLVIAFLAGLLDYPTFQQALVPSALLIGFNHVEASFGLPMVMMGIPATKAWLAR